MDDEKVKVGCNMINCRYNLYLVTNNYHCKLKYINIGIGYILDYPHGVKGMCLNYEVKGEIR
jgi:hypothetical protein